MTLDQNRPSRTTTAAAARAVGRQGWPLLLLWLLSIPHDAIAQGGPRLLCPCDIFASGAPDSTQPPEQLTVTAGIAADREQDSGALRLQLWRHSNASAWSGYFTASTIDIGTTLSAGTSLAAASYTGSYPLGFGSGTEPYYYSLVLQERIGGTWRSRDRVRMQGRARAGSFSAPASRHIDLRSIDFTLDSDGDGVSDHQEIMALTNPFDPVSVPAAPRVRILAYHTQSAAADLGGDVAAGVIHALESSNQMYVNSGVRLELELASLVGVTIGQQQSLGDLLSAMNNASGTFSDLDTQRVATQADLTLTFKGASDGAGNGFCGIANLSGFRGPGRQGSNGDMSDTSNRLDNSVNGTVQADCSASTVAHELGHMMGLSHSRPQMLNENSVGTFEWGAGHGETDRFHTIMSYSSPWGQAYGVTLFSTPDVPCTDEDYESDLWWLNRDFSGPCGIDRDDPVNGADAAQALNVVAYQVAAFTRDTDGDGIADINDSDDDGDGTPDASDEAPLDPLSTVDTDLDGMSDARDPDIDNDRVPNGADAFPLNRLEQSDTDGDGIGDNTDPDIDGDGVPNAEDAFPLDANEQTDTDGDGIGDNTDPDIDGDGVANAEDAFPLDADEQSDTDGDGIGDNADGDDDGDGWSDDEELAEGTDPRDSNSEPTMNTGLPLLLLESILDRESP